MQTINLYRYARHDGGVTVSTVRPDVEYALLYRLVADEGMALTDGVTIAYCVDTDDVSIWCEITDSQNKDAQNNMEISDEILGKAKAYDILMGVSE